MLRYEITHPQVLAALASCGHGSLLLIADANYAAATKLHPRATVVHAALTTGHPSVPETVALLSRALPIEAAFTMRAPDARLAAAAAAARNKLAESVQFHEKDRAEFVDLARSSDLGLAIITGDSRRFANVILRVGVHVP